MMMVRADPRTGDLLAWPELAEARARAEAAEDARLKAAGRYRRAPHGEVQNRLRALQEATAEALKAWSEFEAVENRTARQ